MKKFSFISFSFFLCMLLGNSLIAQTYYPIVDTYIDQNVKEKPGTPSTLLVRTTSTTTRIAFLEFDVSNFKGTLDNAKLNLYLSSNNGLFGTEIIDVYEVTSGIISDTITWSGYSAKASGIVIAPDPTASTSITTSASEPNYGWYEWDITPIVQNNIGKTDKVIVALKMRSTSLYARFYSKEGSGNRKPNIKLKAKK